VEAFGAHVGRRREELDEAVRAIAGDGVDHKLTSGLAKVLLDRSEFDVRAAVDPAELRLRVFREAARRGPFAARSIEGGRPTAGELWAGLAGELGATAEALEASLYADHADQQVLLRTDVPSPGWLLHRYNLALVQAVLLRCFELRIELVAPTPGRARQLARALKFHQLLFAVSPMEEGYRLTVDGPTSLFGQTTRYGLALSRAFPAVPLHPRWKIAAEIAWNGRTVRMALSDTSGLQSHYKELGAYETREAQWFAERFEALGSGWSLSREAEPLRQGPDVVVIPDFTFRRQGRVAHLEILGFWRRGSVE
jgi:predicted nuclease of restriction endonuclease-like RecB superfamily